jgi:hypothetical protein
VKVDVYRQGELRGPSLVEAPSVSWWHIVRRYRWRKALIDVMDMEFVFQQKGDVWNDAWRRAVRRMKGKIRY